MDLGLRGKTAIVAAASKGLGRAVAEALVGEGANVTIFSRDEAAIQAAAEALARVATDGAQVLALAADVTDPVALERVVAATVERFGGVDVLYNNAGGPKPGVFDTLDDADFQRAWELNMLSTVRLTRLCLPYMRRQKWGRIITGTSSSVKQPIDSLMLSNSVRSAVTAWSKTLADQVGADGITVNTLAPGRIETARLVELDSFQAERTGKTLEEVQTEKLAVIPVGRYGRPEEFGAAAAFLASEKASYVSGVMLLVDGGAFRGTY
jgi:3-oxoacyl-[acyl-carrier protein] reductase